MKAPVFLVPFTEAYLPAATELYNHYITETTATFYIEPLSQQEFRKTLFHDDPRCKSFVILDSESGAFAGYCYIGLFRPRAGYRLTGEISVYLRPEYTGKGLGRLAIKQIESHARKAGFHAIIASVCGENTRSIKLFERNGYEHVAHMKEVGWKFGRFLDVVYLEKILT